MIKEQPLSREQKTTHGKIAVAKARYLDGYRLLIDFTDDRQQTVDFTEFLNTSALGYLKKYRELKHFMKFHIEKGNVVWGKNWDLIFPIPQLYQGKIEL